MALNLGELFGNAENNRIFFYSLLLVIFFFLFIMPSIETCYMNDKKVLKEKLENIFDKEIYPIDKRKCSRACCKNSGWPYPKELLETDIDPKELEKYVPNNFSCAYGQNLKSGCLCLDKNDINYLTNKAGNLRTD